MHMPLLDVLIPARGDCPWLGEALESIACQTLQPDGVILVDDGLARPEVVDEIGIRLLDSRYRRIPNQGHGIAAALNTGVSSSRAVWIARMDADDVSHPERLERQYRWLSAVGSDVLGCGSQVRLIDEVGTRLGVSRYPTGWAEIKNQLLRHSCFAHPALVLRREALLATPYRSALDGAEDVDLILRLSERGQLTNLDEILLDYRIHVTQENFLRRARQTALQELAFRLAATRLSTGFDPLVADPGLAERFVTWRLQLPGYAQSRLVMTALRYLLEFARGRNFAAVAACLRQLVRARLWRPDVLGWISRIRRGGPGVLAEDDSPFSVLNSMVAERVAEGDRHA